MTAGGVQVAQVVMPEKGIFLVRCPSAPPPCGTRAVVALDYGPDMGLVTSGGPYDPARHGARPPGFSLVRAKTAADDAVLAENERLAQTMRAAFQRAARAAGLDLRVPYARLSFARTRLFIRYAADAAPPPDLSRPVAELRRLFGVSVNAWQMGPRDEVSVLGGLGPCGRPCCCATWQTRYPAAPVAARTKGLNPASLNGTCGRAKCCLAFEDADERKEDET